MLLSLKQIKLPCPRMLPSFAELWPLSSWDSRLDHRWANQSVEFFHPSPSCCRWSSKASLYLQASSPSCRLFFSKNQGLKRKVFWKIYIRYTIVGRLKKKTRKTSTLELFDDVWCRLWSILHWIWCCHWAWPISMAKALQLKMRKNSIENWWTEWWRLQILFGLQPACKITNGRCQNQIVGKVGCLSFPYAHEQWATQSLSKDVNWVCGLWEKKAARVHLHSLATSLGDCLWFHKSNTIKYLRVVFPVHQLRTCLFSALEDSELLGPLWRRWLHQASRISQQISLITL